MDSKFINPDILKRFDELIREGNRLYTEFQESKNKRIDNVATTQWVTSCFNLLDKLSVSTNRFATEFDHYVHASNETILIGAALGVVKSAKEEYSPGLAIDYHL